MAALLCLLLLAAPAIARDVTDEEYARFPRLYHLDDYDACLSQTGGLYCLGSFHVTPLQEPHHLYIMMKEYSQDPHHFNRTQLHRGYCVSARCPALAERNVSLRFERCVSRWSRRLVLRATLSQLSYCRTHAQEVAHAHSPEPMDLAHRVFLYVVLLIVALNAVGTIYDVFTGDNAKKINVLSAWSLRGNWRRLTATYEDGDPRLAALTPVQGVRVLLMLMIIMTHSGCIQLALYIYNPRWVEQTSQHPALMLFQNGSSVVQVFVMLSNFLLGYNVLLYTKTNKISFKLLPYVTIKRIARISPVYLLVTGYAATWWASAGSGPQGDVVRAESAACRRKYWSHALYVHNLVQPDDICAVQTWFLAVDMQLYLLASVLTVQLTRHRHRALQILAGLIFLSCLLNGALAYVFDMKSIMYFAYPSNLKTMYKGIPSFAWLYQSPWGSLPACLIGLFAAFLHFEWQELGVKVSSFLWVRVLYVLGPWLATSWILAGYYLRQYEAAWFTAAYVALERPLLGALAAAVLLGIINGMEGWLTRVLAWRGWHAMGRMSLSVLMVHWSINLALAAARPQTHTASVLSVVVDWTATSWLSYMVAIPLTVMVEMPVHRFVTALMPHKETKQS